MKRDAKETSLNKNILWKPCRTWFIGSFGWFHAGSAIGVGVESLLGRVRVALSRVAAQLRPVAILRVGVGARRLGDTLFLLDAAAAAGAERLEEARPAPGAEGVVRGRHLGTRPVHVAVVVERALTRRVRRLDVPCFDKASLSDKKCGRTFHFEPIPVRTHPSVRVESTDASKNWKKKKIQYKLMSKSRSPAEIPIGLQTQLKGRNDKKWLNPFFFNLYTLTRAKRPLACFFFLEEARRSFNSVSTWVKSENKGLFSLK